MALREIYGQDKVARAIQDAFNFAAFSSDHIANILEQRERLTVQLGPLHLTRRQDLVDVELGSVATLQEWSDMLGQCSLHPRFAVCSSGGNSNRKSSFWRLVGICVFPCRTGTSRSCSPSEASTPITSRCGVGSSGMPQKWNDVCARGSDQSTTVGECTKPTSGLRASGSIYTRLSTPPGNHRLPSIG